MVVTAKKNILGQSRQILTYSAHHPRLRFMLNAGLCARYKFSYYYYYYYHHDYDLLHCTAKFRLQTTRRLCALCLIIQNYAGA